MLGGRFFYASVSGGIVFTPVKLITVNSKW
jgi:hypothetical protein